MSLNMFLRLSQAPYNPGVKTCAYDQPRSAAGALETGMTTEFPEYQMHPLWF